jgi:phosphopantothenoylcysteine decarboxylase / phosphopantothenate---cysteine ligase
MSLKGKRVLITAGPTWVPIDAVRVISNRATGATGLLLAACLKKKGARVTLVLGPVGSCPGMHGMRLIRFNFFDELLAVLKKELSEHPYDIVLHSAAVSDYRTKNSFQGKLRSGKGNLKISLVPTRKIVDLFKTIHPAIFLVGFKYEPSGSPEVLRKEAAALMKRASCDLVVANSAPGGRYQAYLVAKRKVSGRLNSREELARALVRRLEDDYGRA